MANPYRSSTASNSQEKSASGNTRWSRAQWVTTLASLLAVVVLAIVSGVLITQAVGLVSESGTLPDRVRLDYAATARSSWVGGIAAMVGALLNLGGLILIRKNKLILPLAIHAVTILGMVVIAIVFKPS